MVAQRGWCLRDEGGGPRRGPERWSRDDGGGHVTRVVVTQRGRWTDDTGGGHTTRAMDRRQGRWSHDEGYVLQHSSTFFNFLIDASTLCLHVSHSSILVYILTHYFTVLYSLLHSPTFFYIVLQSYTCLYILINSYQVLYSFIQSYTFLYILIHSHPFVYILMHSSIFLLYTYMCVCAYICPSVFLYCPMGIPIFERLRLMPPTPSESRQSRPRRD